MIGLTEREEAQLKKLQAKTRAAARHEAAFLKEADERKEELLRRWGIHIKPTFRPDNQVVQ